MGRTPLRFWNERLSKYRYQYIIVLLIEELSEYLMLSPLNCYEMFNVFLSHDAGIIDWFFDPVTQEPCIEMFYEQHAIVYETSNVIVRKDSPFIVAMRTSFMKFVYFHERNCLLSSIRLLLLLTTG